MWPSCERLRRFCFAPILMARSTGRWSRSQRGALLMVLLIGQIGLPNFGWLVVSDMACQHPHAAPGSKCQCSPLLRRQGRCCCSTSKSENVRSCCSKKRQSACVKSTTAISKSTKTNCSLSAACPCGVGSDTHALRCSDPRIMPARMIVGFDHIPTPDADLVDESVTGELLPPPLPPPKSCLG